MWCAASINKLIDRYYEKCLAGYDDTVEKLAIIWRIIILIWDLFVDFLWRKDLQLRTFEIPIVIKVKKKKKKKRKELLSKIASTFLFFHPLLRCIPG